MSDIQAPNPTATDVQNIAAEGATVSQPPIQIEKPSVNRQDDEKSLIQEETISIFERAVKAREQLLSLTSPDAIINVLVNETKRPPEQIVEDLSIDYFPNADLFNQHIMAFRDSILTANEALKTEETPFTLKAAYEAYRNCRQAIVKNLDTELFYWNSKRLTFLPPEITRLTKVSSISLLDNKLSSLPNDFFTLKTLTKLTLNDNIISQLPEPTQELQNLTEFFMINNRLANIPRNIKMLVNLQMLYLGQNRLNEIPEDLCILKNLKKLHVGDNNLTELPSNIDMLENLIMLTAWGNKLASLPASIVNLKYLSQLYLNGNQFQSEPPELSSIKPRLYDLNVALNPYTR